MVIDITRTYEWIVNSHLQRIVLVDAASIMTNGGAQTQFYHLQENTNNKSMKKLSINIRLLITLATFGIFTSVALAGPGAGYWKTLGKESDFSQMKEGSKAVYVCTHCNTLTEIPVKSKEHAMEMCKDGASMSCNSCKKVSKVVRKRGRSDAPTHTEVSYVDENGKECGFMAAAIARP